jgi:hypothetical protein
VDFFFFNKTNKGKFSCCTWLARGPSRNPIGPSVALPDRSHQRVTGSGENKNRDQTAATGRKRGQEKRLALFGRGSFDLMPRGNRSGKGRCVLEPTPAPGRLNLTGRSQAACMKVVPAATWSSGATFMCSDWRRVQWLDAGTGRARPMLLTEGDGGLAGWRAKENRIYGRGEHGHWWGFHE